MEAVSQQIYNTLTASLDFQSLFGTSLYPLHANEINEADLPYAVYHVVEEVPLSKEAFKTVFAIRMYFTGDNAYQNAVRAVDLVKNIFQRSDEFDFLSSEMSIEEETLFRMGIVLIEHF